MTWPVSSSGPRAVTFLRGLPAFLRFHLDINRSEHPQEFTVFRTARTQCYMIETIWGKAFWPRDPVRISGILVAWTSREGVFGNGGASREVSCPGPGQRSTAAACFCLSAPLCWECSVQSDARQTTVRLLKSWGHVSSDIDCLLVEVNVGGVNKWLWMSRLQYLMYGLTVQTLFGATVASTGNCFFNRWQCHTYPPVC